MVTVEFVGENRIVWLRKREAERKREREREREREGERERERERGREREREREMRNSKRVSHLVWYKGSKHSLPRRFSLLPAIRE